MELEDSSEKGEKVRQVARAYYKRKDVQKALVAFSQNREVVPRYFESFGRRPDTLQYESDVLALAEKGATSFHASQELWQDPLQISTEMPEQEVNNLRTGWDLIIDIDTKYLDYGKITAELLIEALKFHNVHSFGIKYSGSRGFHIGLAHKAFPEKIAGIETKNFFPQGARAITNYLYGIIKSKLAERVSDMAGVKIRDAVLPDLVLVSPRHLFRTPYSLHEKTSLSSIVIKPEQLSSFQPGWAKPELIYPKPFLPEPEENEARELLVQALDFTKKTEEVKTSGYSERREKVVIKSFSPEISPPCISLILKGLKNDGRKRALFVLMNYFKSLNLDYDEIEKRVADWNKLNYKPLRDGYVKAQLIWSKRQKAILPPNCDKTVYEEIGVCNPDGLCGVGKTIKNPVNYTVRKVRMTSSQNTRRNNGRKNKTE